MSYIGPFDREFMKHTLEILKGYEGKYNATILINCLLGLLIVPKESCFMSIPEDPLVDLAKWGISDGSIESVGTRENADNLRGLVHSLRNSVAHFNFEPVPAESEVTAFRFADMSGFAATIKLEDMNRFVCLLAEHIQNS